MDRAGNSTDQTQLRYEYARTMVDEMYQFVALLDPDGVLLDANLPALNGAGITRQDVVNKPFWFARWWQVSREINDRLKVAISEAKAGRFVRYEVEIYGARAGNEVIWIDFSLNPVQDEKGHLVYLLAEGRNITEKKLAEAEVARKTEELRIAHERLKEFDRLKSEFFANVSHELRTPLTLILGPVRRRLADQGLTGQERHDLQVVERNAQTLLKHVNDLLDLSKLEAGRMQMDWAKNDLAALARRVTSHFDVLAREKPIQFEIQAPEVLLADIDGEKVQRILLNLLSNAFKFTPAHGRIILGLQARNGRAILTVQDNGPGIPEQKRQTVFERFRQVEGGSTRKHGGTGLGLAIVKEFVELHHGQVSVGEAPGGGALFTVELPLTAPAAVQVQSREISGDEEAGRQAVAELTSIAPATARSSAANAPLVLVVEDNPEMNNFIAETLGEQCRVATAFDGVEGLDKALALHPDLVISDVMMPNKSGDEMVVELRQREATADVPIILLTAKADDNLRLRMLKAGVQEYLGKPFSAEELLARVGRLLTERQRVKETLAESERRFRSTFEQAAVGIAHVNLDGHWLRVNQKLCDIVGYGREELLGKTFQEITHPDDLERDLQQVQQILAGQIEHYSLEKRYIRKDGESVWINLTVSAVRKPSGEPDYFIAVVKDISDRKRAEEQLRQAKEAAEAASSAKDHFLAVVSHELRTPLNPILAAATYLERRSDLPASMREEVQMIRRNVEHEGRLVDDLLNLTRLNRGKIELHQEAVDAHMLVRNVLGQFQSEIDAKEIEVSIALRAHQHFVWADPGRMQQVIINLLGNAVKFTGQGGRIILRSSDTQGGRFRLELRDSGIGIEPDILPRLFSAFEQGERTLARTHGGLGLGLAISKGIVDLHGGTLTAHSEGRNKGATFVLELTAAPAIPEIESSSPQDQGQARQRGYVLLVEDHADTLWLMSKMLTSLGFRVVTASNVTQATALVDREKFDLLVSDIGLPDGSGLDVMRHVQQKYAIKGIALSGFGQEEDFRRSQEAGFAQHLTKPVSMEQLEQTILAISA